MTSLDDLRLQAGRLMEACASINAKTLPAASVRPRRRSNRTPHKNEPRLARH